MAATRSDMAFGCFHQAPPTLVLFTFPKPTGHASTLMTPQLPTSNLLVRVISQKFRQLLGQSTEPSDDDKIANTGDNKNNATMGSFDGASPSLPPPTLDVNPAKFEQGDDFVQGIMDEILTDEAEYDRSFDEYTGTRSASVERGDEQSESASEGINVAAETEEHFEKMLPYSSPCPSYKRQKLQEVKQTTSSESEDESDQEAASSSEESPSEEGFENVHDQCGEKKAEREQEEYILESLSLTQREELLHFMREHPFVGKRPIRRTARRQFMRDIRDKATEIGMNQDRIALLERHVRKLYLEIHKIDADPEGSEFGPELDDEYVPTGLANIQKRKWNSGKESSSKFRRIKREFSEEILPECSAPSHDADRDVDIISMEDSAISVSEGNSTQTNLDHGRPDLDQDSPFSEEESDGDKVASKGRGVEEAADPLKSATEPLEYIKSSHISSMSKSTRALSRSSDDARKGAPSTARRSSSYVPCSNATPSEKIVVIFDSSNSKSSTAPDLDSPSDNTANADKKKSQLEKKRMKKRNRRQAKKHQKRRESLTADSTALSESQPKGQVPSKKISTKTKKNTATGHGNTAFDDDYWDLTDF
ncbi:hypothetical protein BJX96DRAFT_165995 [Aspergillus floccosus]